MYCFNHVLQLYSAPLHCRNQLLHSHDWNGQWLELLRQVMIQHKEKWPGLTKFSEYSLLETASLD